MKRKIIVTLMACIMTNILGACGNDGSSVSIVEEKAAAESSVKTESKTENIEVDNKLEFGVEEKTDSELETQDISLYELEELVMADVEGTIGALSEEYQLLLSNVDTYEKYLANITAVEECYKKIYVETRSLCVRLREYSIDYAKLIITSDKSFDEKYDEFETIYDCIYEDAGDEMYDEIYAGILDDAYDDLYNGILDDAYDNAEYKEWAEARANEYEWWSDTRSDVYKEWSDCRSDVYGFWSDMRGEMWDDDIEKAYKKINNFIDDIEKIKSESEHEENESTDVSQQTGEKIDLESSKTDSDIGLVDGMRPEFKEAMDSYEVFYEEYCNVLKKYNSNPEDMTILLEYTELMQKSVEIGEKFEAWDEGEMNDVELKYYLEVNGRVTQMLIEASGL